MKYRSRWIRNKCRHCGRSRFLDINHSRCGIRKKRKG